MTTTTRPAVRSRGHGDEVRVLGPSPDGGVCVSTTVPGFQVRSITSSQPMARCSAANVSKVGVM